MNLHEQAREYGAHETRHTSMERPLSVYPQLQYAFTNVAGLLRVTTMTCISHALHGEDYETYKTLHELLQGVQTVAQHPEETRVSSVTPGGHKKYPRSLAFTTTVGEKNQTLVVSVQKPKDKVTKGKIDVVYGEVRSGRHQSGISLEKIKRVRQTNTRRRKLTDFVVEPSCLSIDQEGMRQKNPIAAYGEMTSEFDDLYDVIMNVYADALS